MRQILLLHGYREVQNDNIQHSPSFMRGGGVWLLVGAGVGPADREWSYIDCVLSCMCGATVPCVLCFVAWGPDISVGASRF